MSHARESGLPCFQPFWLSHRLIPTAKDFGLNFGMNLVIRAKNFRLVFVKPKSKPPAFVRTEFQHRLFELFYGHVAESISQMYGKKDWKESITCELPVRCF